MAINAMGNNYARKGDSESQEGGQERPPDEGEL